MLAIRVMKEKAANVGEKIRAVSISDLARLARADSGFRRTGSMMLFRPCTHTWTELRRTARLWNKGINT